MKRLVLLPAVLLVFGSPASQALRAQPDHKVLICHLPPGNPANSQEILVDYHAVPAHIANHGDTVGACEILIPE